MPRLWGQLIAASPLTLVKTHATEEKKAAATEKLEGGLGAAGKGRTGGSPAGGGRGNGGPGIGGPAYI